MAKDPAILAHQEWLGYVQPVGLVVSIPAMLDANLRVNQNSAPDHRRFLEALPSSAEGDPNPEIDDFPRFAQDVLGWSPSDLCGTPGSDPVPASFEVALPEYNETLLPTYALRDFDPDNDNPGWILLVKVLPKGTRFDDPGRCRFAALAGEPAGQVRAPASANASPHRFARQRSGNPARLRSRKGTERIRDFQAIRNAQCRRPAHLRRLPHAAEFGAALQCRQERAPARDSRKQPQVPERRLHAAC